MGFYLSIIINRILMDVMCDCESIMKCSEDSYRNIVAMFLQIQQVPWSNWVLAGVCQGKLLEN